MTHHTILLKKGTAASWSNSAMVLILLFFISAKANAQIVLPEKIDRAHPRTLAIDVDKADLLSKVKTDPEVAEAFIRLKKNVDEYVDRHVTDPEWIVSRLQMYWKTHSTDVYINAGVYSHAEGHAPVPTVRFTGARDYVIDHLTPSIEDIKPYMDDERGIWAQHKTTQEWEWVPQAKTGRIIENINAKIMSLANDAALIYWLEGDEKYAKFAADIFDTYMVGMSYRSEPIDITKGHHQDIVGLTSFQVIKEGVLEELVGCYDYLYDYLLATAPEQMPVYTVSLRKFAEIIIKNGVPFNNWNLFEAQFVAEIALVLEDDSFYADGKGSQYYLDRVLNKTEARQWSLDKLLGYGYDANTGIWNESPGYSMNMVRDFMKLALRLQNTMNLDIVPYMPVLPKAVKVLPQYMFPNHYIVGFGDTHYTYLNTGAMRDMVVNARKFNKPEQEREFTALANMISSLGEEVNNSGRGRLDFRSLLDGEGEFEFDKSIPAASLKDYVTQTFYAPNVSWLVQRNGLDPKHGLMISQAGSLGNHMHSNGIAMELYGKGYVLAPEGGVGRSYFQSDYLEYYSQFPAHNTVAVDGISKYPEMLSTHAFSVDAMYPEAERDGFYPEISFSDLYFLEPATDADQNRVMSIVRTGGSTGYYVDIFRSRRRNEADKYHDYFYHNLGQELVLADRSGQPLQLSPSERLSSAEGDLTAYDYLTDKQSVQSAEAFTASYTMTMEGEESVRMDMWMQGDESREMFKVLAPPSEAFRSKMVPQEISEAPLQTMVVRQTGEAWTRPFVAVYEPSTESEPATIRSVEVVEQEDFADGFVALKIESLTDRTDLVLSSDTARSTVVQDISFLGTYGVVSTEGENLALFLGAGTKLEKAGYGIQIVGQDPSAATLVIAGDSLQLTTDAPALISIPDTFKKGEVYMMFDSQKIRGIRLREKGKKTVDFEVPVISFQTFQVQHQKK
ncbi:heparinase II/III family protein [Algoriphagus jejuensis]|uniref:Heparinase II/III family protein n=1 Tax=Algoriphagus jejuensis TaxID=419934 RepID=A0ABP3Y748_9BACT